MGRPRKRRAGNGSSPPSIPKGPKKRPSSIIGELSIVKILALAAGLVIANYAYLVFWRASPWSSSYTVTGAVEVRNLTSPQEKFAKDCEKGAVPVVLRNSVTALWKAKEWNPRYLESKLKVVSGIYKNDNRWFGPYFDVRKPLTSFSTRMNSYRTDVQLKGEEFFPAIENPTEGEFLYFTGDIEQLGGWAFDEIQPVNELLVLNPKRSSINAWIGQPHVIAHCHYDGYHNFYAQLYGTKKFTLFRPTNWPGLYPYPFLHPSHAQAQVNVSDVSDAHHFPLIDKVEAVEVILEPGDLLYMPPLWFHHVESMDVSISVNVWTDSKQTELMERMFSLPLPIDTAIWPSEHMKAVATSLLVFSVLEGVCHAKKCPTPAEDSFKPQEDSSQEIIVDRRLYFIHRLWTTRYRTLMERGELPGSFTARNSWSGVLCEAADTASQHATLMQDVFAILGETDFKDHARKVANLAKKLPHDTWELWIGNYVEFVAAQAVPVEYVGLFLQHFGSCIKIALKNA